MYSNHGTSHRGSTPYLSLKPVDYAMPERSTASSRTAFYADQTTPPLTPTSSSRDYPQSKANLAAPGGPLSSHPVTPIDNPESFIFTIPAPIKRRPHRAASSHLDAMTDSTTAQFDALSTNDHPAPDLTLRMPGSSTHQHSHSMPLNQMHQFEHPSRRRRSQTQTFASRFLRLRSLSSLRSAASSIRGNDSKASLQLRHTQQSTTTLSHNLSLDEKATLPEGRPMTAAEARVPTQYSIFPPAGAMPASRGTKRPASPSSPPTRAQQQAGEPVSPSTSAGRATLSRRARQKSMELLSSARRASGLYLWGGPGDAEQGEREDAEKENESWRLPEIQGIHVPLNLDFE